MSKRWAKTGKRLDIGKSCVRIKKLEDIPLPLIGKLFKRIKAKSFIQTYEEALAATPAKKKKKAR